MRPWWLVWLFACGGNSGLRDAAPDTTRNFADAFLPDAPSSPNPGFGFPSDVVHAWTRSGSTYQPATLDLSCLGMARSDPATTVSIALTATVRDFQSNNVVTSTPVAVFAGADTAHPIANATSDGSGVAALTIPIGQRRLGFFVTGGLSAHDTYTFDHLLAPSTASQAIGVASLSSSTFATLPALVGMTAVAGSATYLGTAHDCAGNLLSGLEATVSTARGVPTHVPNSDTFYFSDSVDLPVHHDQQAATTRDGLFMVIDMVPETTAYAQLWGYRDASDMAVQTMHLIAELPIVAPANAALIADQEPHAIP